MSVSIIIPAYNEEKYLPHTLKSLANARFWDEVIIVNDGSKDQTTEVQLYPNMKMIVHENNKGKGSALATGIHESRGDVLLFLDADLQETAYLGEQLILPVVKGEADMTIAKFPPAGKEGGFGLVKNIARFGIAHFTQVDLTEPLSGQRCIHRGLIPTITSFDLGFGIEVGMTIDTLRAGYTIREVEIPFQHRGLGKTIAGFKHRGNELQQILKTLWIKRKG